MKECTTRKLTGLSFALRYVVVLTASVALVTPQAAAGAVSKHELLTGEEVAVYKAFMSYFAARTPSALVADVTVSFPIANGDQCLHGIKLEKNQDISTDHTLPQEIIPVSGRFKLVTIRPGSWHPEGPVGLLQLSEIAFDARHQYAVLIYDFHCGALCGEGARVVFKKVPGGWKHIRSCGNWMS